MNQLDRILGLLEDYNEGKVKIPDFTIKLDKETIGLIVAGVGALFGVMFLGVYWLIKSTLKK